MVAFIKPLGMLKTYTHGAAMVPVDADQTIRSALDGLNIPSQLVALVLINDQPQEKVYLLQDGDIVQVMAVIGGG